MGLPWFTAFTCFYMLLPDIPTKGLNCTAWKMCTTYEKWTEHVAGAAAHLQLPVGSAFVGAKTGRALCCGHPPESPGGEALEGLFDTQVNMRIHATYLGEHDKTSSHTGVFCSKLRWTTCTIFLCAWSHTDFHQAKRWSLCARGLADDRICCATSDSDAADGLSFRQEGKLCENFLLSQISWRTPSHKCQYYIERIFLLYYLITILPEHDGFNWFDLTSILGSTWSQNPFPQMKKSWPLGLDRSQAEEIPAQRVLASRCTESDRFHDHLRSSIFPK